MNYSNPSFVGPLPNRYDVNKDGKIDNSDIDEINKIISEGDPKKNEIFLHDPEIAKNNRINKINDFAENEYNNISMRILDFDEDNGSKYRKWYDKEFGTNLEVNKSDWCAAFVTYLFAQNDGLNKYIVNSTCADNLVRESIKAGLGTWHEDKSYTDKNNVSTYIPKKGDLILFNPQYNGLYYPYPASANYSQDKDAYVSSHIGYIYDVYIPAEDSDNKSIIIYTIEGNKSNTVSKAEYEIDFSSNEPTVDQRINGYYSPDYNK